jgi:hypothetical protein
MAGIPIPSIITECTGTTDGWENTFRWDAKNLVVNPVRAGSTGLLMWNLALDENSGPKRTGGCENCRGLVTVNSTSGALTPTPEFYTQAHLSRAATPGATNVGVTSLTDMPMVAFKNPDNTFGVFGFNDTSTAQVISIAVSGGGAQRFSVGAHELFTLRGPAGAPTGSPTTTTTPATNPVSLTPGTIIRSTAGDLHLLSGSMGALIRHWIPDAATLNCETARGTASSSVAPDDVLGVVEGGWHYCYDIDTLKGRILSHPDGDSHYIGTDGIRHWIPSTAIYYCLVGRGIPTDTVRWRDYNSLSTRRRIAPDSPS